MITGGYEMLTDTARTHMCPLHPENNLEVIWDQSIGYGLRCGAGHYPDEVTRQMSLTQTYKAGEEMPDVIKSNVEKSIRRRSMQQDNKPTAITFQGVPAQDLGTGELLAPEMIRALVDYAAKYNLDPARGHVCLMYSKPYITLDGYLYHAHKTGRPYSMTNHPLGEADRSLYQVPEGAHAWSCSIRYQDGGGLFGGIGIVTREEMTEESKKKPGQLRSPVVAAHPWQLAQKRAEWQALRRAFPIGETEEEKER